MKKYGVILVIGLSCLLSACSTLGSTTVTTAGTSAPTPSPTTTASTTATESQAPTTTQTTAVPTTTQTTEATTTETTAATETTGGIQVLTGTFQKAEWGDYLHVDIKGDDGVDYSFFVLKYPGIDIETLTAGTKVKVTWQNVNEYLDPPGETVNIDKIIKIELVE
jgi:hypothetical protein